MKFQFTGNRILLVAQISTQLASRWMTEVEQSNPELLSHPCLEFRDDFHLTLFRGFWQFPLVYNFTQRLRIIEDTIVQIKTAADSMPPLIIRLDRLDWFGKNGNCLAITSFSKPAVSDFVSANRHFKSCLHSTFLKGTASHTEMRIPHVSIADYYENKKVEKPTLNHLETPIELCVDLIAPAVADTDTMVYFNDIKLQPALCTQ